MRLDEIRERADDDYQQAFIYGDVRYLIALVDWLVEKWWDDADPYEVGGCENQSIREVLMAVDEAVSDG